MKKKPLYFLLILYYLVRSVLEKAWSGAIAYNK